MADRKTKHDVLTEEELESYQLPQPFLRELEALARRRDAETSAPPAHVEHSGRRLRVLDWGCGRGRAVAVLLAAGYDAYGVELDPEPLANGAAAMRERGHDPVQRLHLLDGGQAPFASQSFDAIISDQLLEHVEDLDAVAYEMARLLAPHGFTLHQYPGHRRIIEPHLELPLVHWLPKGAARGVALDAMLRVGLDPDWPEMRQASHHERVATYRRYSETRTYYRTPRSLGRVFRRYGLRPRFWSSPGPGGRISQKLFTGPLRGLWDWKGCRFDTVWLQTIPRSGF